MFFRTRITQIARIYFYLQTFVSFEIFVFVYFTAYYSCLNTNHTNRTNTSSPTRILLFEIFVFVFPAIIVSVQLFASFEIFVFATNPSAYHSRLILRSKMPVCIQTERQDHEVAHTLTREIRRIGGALQGES